MAEPNLVKELGLEVPVVHRNGTDIGTLVDQYINSARAISEAIRVMQDGMPHARDYYVRQDGMESYRKARDQHCDRIERLRKVKDEIQAIAEALAFPEGN